MRRHQLAEDVGADALQMRGDLGIVEARVAALHLRIGEPRAGLHEELGDLDVGRQASPAQRLGVVEIGIAIEQAVEQGLNEAPLEASCDRAGAPG